MVEVGEERGIHNELPRNPTALLRSITCPVCEILEPAAAAPDFKQPADLPLRVTIYEFWRRRLRDRGHKRTAGDRLNSRDVEDRMNVHGGRQLQPNSRRAQDFLDFKRTNEAGREFLVGGLEGNVLRGQPDPLSLLVLRRRGTSPVSPSASALPSLEQRCPGGPPDTLTALQVELYGGNGHFILLWVEQGRLIPQGCLERRKSRCRDDQGIGGVLYPWSLQVEGLLLHTQRNAVSML